MSGNLRIIIAVAAALALAVVGCSRQPLPEQAAAPTAAAPNPEMPGDAAEARLETAVRLALLEKLGIQGLNVNLGIEGDAVTLSGEVATAADKTIALETVRGVAGVGSVTDHLRVVATSGAPVATAVPLSRHVEDEIVANRVKLALFNDLDAAAFAVDVTAKGGEVTLSGTVPSQQSNTLAVATARSTEGVTSVVDQLKVGSPAETPGPYE